MKTILIFLSVLFLLTDASAQLVLNQTDSQHLKQGKWIGKYSDGKVRYEGYFDNDKPVKEWKRYHENGKLKAILVYVPNSEKVKAELYDLEGSLFSKGNYNGKEKDSIWTYFNNKVIVARESYQKGLKNGKSFAYYSDGKTADETEWLNGKLNGIWREFYPSGNKKSEISYLDGKRQGNSRIYFESGQTQIEGLYDNDQCAGTWKFYNPEGKIKLKLEYKEGTLQNPDALDSLELVDFNAFDKAKGTIKDPEHYRENPEEFLKK